MTKSLVLILLKINTKDKYNVNDIDLAADDVVKSLYQPDALVAIGEIHPFWYDEPNLFTYQNQIQKVTYEDDKHVVGFHQHNFEHL